MAPDTAEKVGKATPPTFQDVIMNLQRYWASTISPRFALRLARPIRR